MPSGIRFDPPRIELTPDIRWVLLRSLGPATAPAPAGLDPGAAAGLAGRLTVDARIAARMGRDALVTELGEAAAPLLAQRVRAVATEIAHDRTIERCAEIGTAAGIPLAILKGYALRVTDRLVSGGRQSADVDLLVPGDRAAEFHAALRECGFDPGDSGTSGPEQHLAGLVDPEGGVVEVHTKLLGVSDGGGASLGWMELNRNCWLEELPDVGEGCYVPSKRVLAAHALAHGIAQHGRRPSSYALLWMLGDLIDLEMVAADGSSLGELIAGSVSQEEVDATLELAEVLGRGEVTADGESLSAGARVMLDHVLAGRLDENYRSQAPLRVFEGRLSDRSRARVVTEDLLTVAFPSRATLEAVYGEAGAVGRLGHRLRWVGSRASRLIRAILARG